MRRTVPPSTDKEGGGWKALKTAKRMEEVGKKIEKNVNGVEGSGRGVEEEKRTQPPTGIKMDQSNLIMPRY